MCSIQCHTELDDGGYCFAGRMHNTFTRAIRRLQVHESRSCERGVSVLKVTLLRERRHRTVVVNCCLFVRHLRSRVAAVLELIPAVKRGKRQVTPGSPVYHRATWRDRRPHTHIHTGGSFRGTNQSGHEVGQSQSTRTKPTDHHVALL